MFKTPERVRNCPDYIARKGAGVECACAV